MNDALAQYRADLTEQHMATVAFVDYAASEAPASTSPTVAAPLPRETLGR